MRLSVGTRMGSTPLQYTSPSAGRGEWRAGGWSMSGGLIQFNREHYADVLILGQRILLSMLMNVFMHECVCVWFYFGDIKRPFVRILPKGILWLLWVCFRNVHKDAKFFPINISYLPWPAHVRRVYFDLFENTFFIEQWFGSCSKIKCVKYESLKLLSAPG